jgi:hypothetical protein
MVSAQIWCRDYPNKLESVMHIAYVSLSGRGLIDDCISKVVELLFMKGLRLAGTVRAQPVDQELHPCDMDLRILPNGPLHRISQSLGAGSKGCRLDGGAIEDIATEVESRLAGADLLIVNKFGKQEALGRGLRPTIAKAIDLSIPVLVGVNRLNLPDFLDFVDGAATALQPYPWSAIEWLDSIINPELQSAARNALEDTSVRMVQSVASH